MNSLSRRLIPLLAAVLALGLTLASNPMPALAGNTRIVDDDYGTPGACKGAGYATVQAAVDSIPAGKSGTIKLCPGTYNENVTISGLGKIKIVGMPGAIMTADGSTPLIKADNTTRLIVQGLTLDGTGYAITDGLIRAQNSSAQITKNVFQNGMAGFGFVMANDSGTRTLKVLRNQFSSVAGAMYVSAVGGSVSVRATGNDLSGSIVGMTFSGASSSSVNAIVTGNHLQGTNTGIQMASGRKARISGNTVDGFALGIVLQDTSYSSVTRNTLSTAHYGVAFVSSGIDTSRNRVLKNTIELISDNTVGIYLQASPGTIMDRTQVKNNTIADLGSHLNTGGIVLTGSGGTYDKTQIVGNRLNNIVVPYYHFGDTNTVIKKNTCTPSSPCVTP